MILMRNALALVLIFIGAPPALAKNPDCSGTGQWPTLSAFAYLKNSGLTDNDKLDFAKTITTRVASERIGKNLFRQIHHIEFVEKSGTVIEVIAVNDASMEECSMSSVDVYVISQHFTSAASCCF